MASITLCPRCSSHLELPVGASPTSRIECPICEAEFLLASVAPRVVPKARVIDAAPASFSALLDADPASSSPAAQSNEEADAVNAGSPSPGLSHLLRGASAWQLSAPQEPDDVTAEFATDEDDDHARLDAAYQDAAAPNAPAPPGMDPLQLEGSRLDQLLSELMKTPKPSESLKRSELAESQPAAALPSFDEVDAPAESPAVADETEEDERSRDDQEQGDDEETVTFRATADGPASGQQPVGVEWNEFEDSSAVYADHDEEDDRDDAEGLSQEFDLPTPVRQSRRPAGLRTLVGVVGGGVLGILGGGYFLLWYNGPAGDLLGISKWLPAALLPATAEPTEPSAFAATNPWSTHANGGTDASARLPAPAPVVGDASALEQPALVDANEPASTSSTNEEVAMRHDAAVAPASAETPAPLVAAPPAVAIPNWPTTPIVGSLRGVPSYSIADLEEALVGADAAQRQFLAGDLSRKEDVAAMGKAFIELCGLAERYTLTDPAEYGNELIAKQLAAKQVFRGMVGDPARRNDLAMISGRWLQHERRQNQGVILLGRVSDIRAQGPWTEYAVDVSLGDSVAPATVLTDGVKYSVGDEIAVVGAIVGNPRQTIADYQGEAPQVVVAGLAFPPEDYVAAAPSEAGDLFSIKP